MIYKSKATYTFNSRPLLCSHVHHLRAGRDIPLLTFELDTKEFHQHLGVGCDRLRHLRVLCCQLLDQRLRVVRVGRDGRAQLLDLRAVAQRVHVELLASCSRERRRGGSCSGTGTSCRLLLLLGELEES